MEEHGYYRDDLSHLNLQSSFWRTTATRRSPPRDILILLSIAILIILAAAIFRLRYTLSPESTSRRPRHSTLESTHIAIVLGSGGHTAEMLNILSQMPQSLIGFSHRTYIVSSGDDFSALKAHEFETSLLAGLKSSGTSVPPDTATNYDVVTVHRARKVHQSILTAPISSLWCLWDCMAVLRGTHREFTPRAARRYPDLILTNGPGTGVIVILASIILRFFGLGRRSAASKPFESYDADTTKAPDGRHISRYARNGQTRSIFVESWARVRTLSLSGRLLKPFVDRFIVQWPQLVEEEGSGVEYIGPLVT